MSELLLQTKLITPPLRRSLVPRPQLDDKIRRGLRRKLILVAAPAGFGKTTLISSWIQREDQASAWLSLDKEDNEPSRFLLYLISALQQVDEQIRDAAVSLLQSMQPPPLETVLTLLINDLAQQSKPIVLVLDDYHVINNLDVHQGLTILLENQPQQLHMVIISREDPPFPLHRLRGGGQMIGIYV